MAARSIARHPCFWPGCARSISVDKLGCRGHWYALPKLLRDRIWQHYVPGQTVRTCSAEYREALADVLGWARQRQAEKDAQAERLAELQRLQVPLF